MNAQRQTHLPTQPEQNDWRGPAFAAISDGAAT